MSKVKSHWIQSYHDKWTMCGRYEANSVHRTISYTHVTCKNCLRIIEGYKERARKCDELAETFRKLVAEDETLTLFINRIKVEDQGISYLWDGLMNCHLVIRLNHLVDVQDVEDGWKPWNPRIDGSNTFESPRFKSVEDYIDNLKKTHCHV